MKAYRIFKTIFLTEFISGLFIAIRDTCLESQKLLIILLKKDL